MLQEHDRAASQRIEEPEMALISAYEYKRILIVSGYSYPEVARYIGKSRSYVANVANGYRPITFRQVQELQRFLGSRLYTASLTKVRKDLEDMRKRQIEQNQRFEVIRRQRLELETARAAQEREQKASEIERQLSESDTIQESSDGGMPSD